MWEEELKHPKGLPELKRQSGEFGEANVTRITGQRREGCTEQEEEGEERRERAPEAGREPQRGARRSLELIQG